MLDAYVTQTQRLLQNPAAPTSLYATSDITSWINTARGQLAGEAECCRIIATINTVVGQQEYQFASVNIGNPTLTGIQGIIHVRRINYVVGTGFQQITNRNWEWFDFYHINNPVPNAGTPTTWAQYGQGAAPGSTGSLVGGSFYLNPVPDQVYSLSLDCVCYPNALAINADPEAIPYLFTDAVPFFAAYYALLSAQTNARMADAERYFNYYNTFLERARKASNASINRWQYEQSQDPVQALKLGVKPGGGA